MLCLKETAQETKACNVCGGTGIYPGGLSYQEALKTPEKQHFNDFLKKNGITDSLLKSVPYLMYFKDGKPRCPGCLSKHQRS